MQTRINTMHVGSCQNAVSPTCFDMAPTSGDILTKGRRVRHRCLPRGERVVYRVTGTWANNSTMVNHTSRYESVHKHITFRQLRN